MDRGEKGGVVLDGPGEEGGGPGPEEGADAALTPIEEIDKVVPEPGGEPDAQRGTETPEAGKDGGSEESEIPQSGEGAGEEVDPRISNIEKVLKEVREKLAAKPVESAKELSDEDWAKLEQEWGSPKSTIERITRQNVQVVNKLMDYIDSKFAKLEFVSSLETLSKEANFTDALRYKKEVNEFLSDYDPRHWSNPELLKKAVFYARGINANGNIAKARNDSERNRKIAGPARPSAPNGGQRKPGFPPLRADQKEVAEMMGGEKEYNNWRSGRRTLE